jgi:hypothetical protein
MSDLVPIPAEEPAFLSISATEDPIVKQAKSIRDADAESSERAGFEKAIRGILNTVQSDMEMFHQNVLARVSNAKTQCEMMLSSFRMLGQETDEEATGDTIGKVYFDLVHEIRNENVHTDAEGRSLYQMSFAAAGEFNDFQNDNDLKRPPREPQNLIITIALLIALVVAEIVLNGFFFMDLSQQGLFGGLFEAFLFAPFNVLAASIVGYYSLRHIRHKTPWKKYLAAVIGVALVMFILALNTYLAALRLSLKSDNIYDIPELIYLIYSTRILQIMDYESLGILVLGFTLAFFAGWKTYNLKDPYPGYDEVNRRKNLADEHVENLRLDYLDYLSEHLDDAVESLKENKLEFIKEVADFQKLIVFIKDERDRFNAVGVAAQKAYADRLHTFHSIYVARPELASPELENTMKQHALETDNSKILLALQEIPELDVNQVMQIENDVRNHIDQIERKMRSFVTTTKENTNQLFEDIRNGAKSG